MINRYLIGIDIGGTDTKAGIVDSNGSIIVKKNIETRPKKGAQDLAERVYLNCEKLIDDASLNWKNIISIGIGAPGILDIKRGLIIFSPNLKGWVNVPIVKIFQKKLNMECILENDANAAAWGEKWAGVASGKEIGSLVMITLGTGIGGGIVIGDKIWHGCSNAAGELGHITIEINGARCGCGNYGCVEAYASATAVVRRYREASNARTDITAEDVYNLAVNGNKIAKKIMDETGKYIGIAIVNIIHTLNPDFIVIGGGMAAARDLLVDPIFEEIEKRSFKLTGKRTNIVFGRLGNDAGIIGAAGWALKTLETSV